MSVSRFAMVLVVVLAASQASGRAVLADDDNGGGAAVPAAPKASMAEEATELARLGMTKPRACRSIDGYQKFEPLPDDSLTAEEKLLIYFEPLHYRSIFKDGRFIVHLTEDGRLRRKGEKEVLRWKDKMLDYVGESRDGKSYLFLRNSVSLKGLPPGDYEFDMILRDEQKQGPPATQTLSFRIIPTAHPAKAETGHLVKARRADS